VIVPVGIFLSSLLGVVASAAGLRGKVRVWADARLRERFHGDFRRLMDYAWMAGRLRQGFNQAIPVLALSLFLPVTALGTGWLMWFGAAHPNNPPTLPYVVGFCLLFGGPLAMIPVYGFLSSRTIAQTPADCWPPLDSGGREW
jgi:hypothetical protein